MLNSQSSGGIIHTRALRLVFDRDGSDIRLVEAIPVEMVVPPSDRLADDEDVAGFWISLYDEGGSIAYRRVMSNPLGDELEVYTGDPEQPFKRVRIPEPKLQFEVIVPDLPEARAVGLFASLPLSDRNVERARQVARFELPTRDRAE